MIVSSTIIVVDPTADLQAAVDATPWGGTLRLGAGTFTVPSGGLVLSRGITICGESNTSTVLQAYSVAAGQPVIKIAEDASITPNINGVHLRDLAIHGRAVDQDNAPAVLAGSYGIDITLDTGQLVRHVSLERLYIWRCSDDGIHVTGNGADTAVIGLRVRDCIINENWGDGAYVQGATLVHFESNLFAQNYGRGCCFESCSPNVVGDYYEGNCHSALLTNGYDGQLRCYAGVVNLSGLTFEAFNTETGSVYLQQQATQVGLALQTVSGSVRACKFYNAVASYHERGIFIDNLNPATLEIGCNAFDGCEVAIFVVSDPSSVSSGFPRNLTILAQHIGSYSGDIRNAPGIANPYTASVADGLGARNEGQMIYDRSTNHLRLWSGDNWQSVVAGQVNYEDEPVIYDDEPVTY